MVSGSPWQGIVVIEVGVLRDVLLVYGAHLPTCLRERQREREREGERTLALAPGSSVSLRM